MKDSFPHPLEDKNRAKRTIIRSREPDLTKKHRLGKRKFQITYHHKAKQQSAQNQESETTSV